MSMLFEKTIYLKEHFKYLDNVDEVIDPFEISGKRYDIYYDLSGYEKCIATNVSKRIRDAYESKLLRDKSEFHIQSSGIPSKKISYTYDMIPVTKSASILFPWKSINREKPQNSHATQEMMQLFAFIHFCYMSNILTTLHTKKTPDHRYSYSTLESAYKSACTPKVLQFSKAKPAIDFVYDNLITFTSRETLQAQRILQKFIDGT